MSASVLVNPDRFLEMAEAKQREIAELRQRLQPTTLRQKLRQAGLDPNLARAPRPVIPATPRRLIFPPDRMAYERQRNWTALLIDIVSANSHRR